MNVSYQWLMEYVDCPLSVEDLAEVLTAAGVAVDRITARGMATTGLIIGRIVDCEPHPGSDRLTVVTVDGGDRNYRVVCGAPNVTVNARVVLAVPGSRLGEREIGTAMIRDVRSEGMICSASELGLFEDRSEMEAGILIVSDQAVVGSCAARYLGLDDQVMELDLTPNRGDCLSMVGVAREVAALTGGNLRQPVWKPGKIGPEPVRITIESPEDCRRYAGRVIEDVQTVPSPDWMQMRLRAAGMRPISGIVDITNYVMLELGQPLHAFDLDKLASPHIIVRRARPGETMVSLDGQERRLEPDMLVIADERGPIALAGVMGGLDSEVTEETQRILFESANFHPLLVRRTARRLGIPSAASARFEKGADPEMVVRAVDRVLELVEDLGLGSVRDGLSDCYPGSVEPETITVRPDRVNKILGTDLDVDVMVDCARRLGFDCQQEDGVLRCVTTTRRPDVKLEVDLVEEIGRVHGYNNITPQLPRQTTSAAGVPERTKKTRRLQHTLTGCGLTEIITYSFINPAIWDEWGVAADHTWRQGAVLRNPLSEERSMMRTTLLAGMVSTLAFNAARQIETMAGFEVGSSYQPQEIPISKLPDEPLMMSAGGMGDLGGRRWHAPEVPADFYWAKGVWEAVAEALGVRDWRLEHERHCILQPGRSANIVVDDRVVGIIGELSKRLMQQYRLPGPASVLEINVDLISGGKGKEYEALPRYPGAVRDLALLVPEATTAGELLAAITEAGGDELVDVWLFDVYAGKGIPEGMRSLGFTLQLQSRVSTLDEQQIRTIMDQVVSDLKNRYGVTVRS